MKQPQRKDEDSAWKDILHHRFRQFLEFFFPEIHEDIDWKRKPEFLDKELEKLLPQDLLGKRLADKLVRVWRRSGVQTWVVVHVEVQGESQMRFARRMFIYNYRVFDRYMESGSGGGEVVSLAVFTGKGTVPRRYDRELWGFRNDFSFPVASLEDFRGREEELEGAPNPFAIAVLAHLKLNETGSVQERKHWKTELFRQLLSRRLARQGIIDMLRFLDWVLVLPGELQEAFETEIAEIQGGKAMPYLSNMERKAIQRGLQKGLEQGVEKGIEKGIEEAIQTALELRFGSAGRELFDAVGKLRGVDRLREFHRAVLTVSSTEELKALLPPA